MNERGRILIVDDEPSVRDSLSRWFRDDGYEVGVAEGANDALTRLAERKWDLALLDIRMRGTDGIELQRRMKEVDNDLTIIIMTGYASVDTAVTALKQGAYDYITKPLDPDDVSHLVRNALSHRRTNEENVRMKEVIENHVVHPTEIVGQGPAMKKVFDAIETVGPTDATVLITGESGTGKELVAKAIHAASTRRYHPMVAIHCGALTETLLESELFGHEKGAFTGAQYRKKGKFEVAEGGTVFLDEIGDISLKTQTDLLRVLQEREIVRVGGHQALHVDFRCVAATNKDLDQLIHEGKFRPDLFYRLNVFHIELPSLRERREDIPLLVDHFVRKYSLQMNKKITRVAPPAMNAVQQYDWPGNVRELENAVERAMVVAREPEIREEDFALRVSSQAPSSLEGKTLDEIEKSYILRVLEECGFNQTRAAEVLDIDRVTLHNKLKKYGWSRGFHEMNPIRVVPVGAPDRDLLDHVAAAVGREFRTRASIADRRLDAMFAHHPERDQYFSTAIVEHLVKANGKTDVVVGITELDLYIPILTFVFGEAQLGGTCAVVSYHRLTQEYYGLPGDPPLLLDRLTKEAIHEVGHTAGLTHCDDYECAMAAAHSVEWLDLKGPTLCAECRARVQ